MTVSIERLSAYVDGELAAEEQAATHAHVAQCADCHEALRLWRRASAVLRDSQVPRRRTRKLAPALVAAGAVLALVVASTAAVALGLFSEPFRSGNVTGYASRPVSMAEARVTGLPLPSSDQVGSGWRVRQVYLTMTPTWSIVDVQYSRPGSVGMGIRVSSGIRVGLPGEATELMTVAGVPVKVRYAKGDPDPTVTEVNASFDHRGSSVDIRGSGDEIDRAELAAIVADWIAQARE